MAQSKIIYGIHAVAAALAHHPENILAVYCQEKESNMRLQTLMSGVVAAGLRPQNVSAEKLTKLTKSSRHQGIAAQVRTNQTLDEKQVFEAIEAANTPPILLLLESIQDPHNFGACLRSAEALGVNWVIVPKHQSSPITPVVSKVSCGADQTLPVVQVSNLVRFIQQIQKRGIWVVGTTAEAKQTLSETNATRPLAIVMGAEGKGLKRLTLESCDELVKIPLVGTVESLNVSVATGICLYEVVRQRSI